MLNTLNYISMSLDLLCVLISLVIFAFLILEERKGTKMNRSFFYITSFNLGILISDMVAWLTTGNTAAYAFYLIRIANYMHYLSGALILAAFTLYMLAYIETKTGVPRRATCVALLICAVSMLMTTISQFTDIYYIIDEFNVYHRQDLYWLSQLLPATGLLINIGIIFYYRKHLMLRNIIYLTSYMLLPVLAIVVQIAFYGITFVNIATTLAVLILYIGVQSEHTKTIEIELAEKRISVMLSQIQPHFLYNSLLVIRQLCELNPVAAGETVVEFSEYLRGNFESLTVNGLIPFDRELKHVEAYLAIEKKRFGDMLNIEYDINARDFTLPALTLQPVIENAVRYGITRRENGGTVSITTRDLKDRSIITITDNGVGFDTEQYAICPEYSARCHIGIENVRTRLALMCGGTLAIKSAPDVGTTVELEIPKRESTVP